MKNNEALFAGWPRIGYAVSDGTPHVRKRLTGLLAEAGCSSIYLDKLPRRARSFPRERQAALNALSSRSLFVVVEWRNAALSPLDGIAILRAIQAAQAALLCLQGPMAELSWRSCAAALPALEALHAEEAQRFEHSIDAALRQPGRRRRLGALQLSDAVERLATGHSWSLTAAQLGTSHRALTESLELSGIDVAGTVSALRRARAADLIAGGLSMIQVAKYMKLPIEAAAEELFNDPAALRAIANKKDKAQHRCSE